MSTPPPPIDTATEILLEGALERRAQGLSARERRAEMSFALVTLVAMVVLAVFAEPARATSLLLAAAFVAVYAIVHRVEFTLGDGNVVPTQLVFVPMLLLLPTPLVPLLVGLGTVAAGAVNALRAGR
jgi:hypothetical protein